MTAALAGNTTADNTPSGAAGRFAQLRRQALPMIEGEAPARSCSIDGDKARIEVLKDGYGALQCRWTKVGQTLGIGGPTRRICSIQRLENPIHFRATSVTAPPR